MEHRTKYRLQTIKFLEVNTGENLEDLRYYYDF